MSRRAIGHIEVTLADIHVKQKGMAGANLDDLRYKLAEL